MEQHHLLWLNQLFRLGHFNHFANSYCKLLLSQFLAFLEVPGSSWKFRTRLPWGYPLGLPFCPLLLQRGRKWGVQLVGTCGLHLLQHLGASTGWGHMGHGQRKSVTSIEHQKARSKGHEIHGKTSQGHQKNGQNLCLIGEFSNESYENPQIWGCFLGPWLIRSKEKLGTALSDVAVKREWAPRLFQGERLKRLRAIEGGWWWWLERLGMYGLEVSNGTQKSSHFSIESYGFGDPFEETSNRNLGHSEWPYSNHQAVVEKLETWKVTHHRTISREPLFAFEKNEL